MQWASVSVRESLRLGIFPCPRRISSLFLVSLSLVCALCVFMLGVRMDLSRSVDVSRSTVGALTATGTPTHPPHQLKKISSIEMGGLSA